MRMFIETRNIDLMCNASKYNHGNKGGNQDGCGTKVNKQNELGPKASKWLTFKTKCKALWGEVKHIALGLTDVLSTATALATAFIGVKKVSKRLKKVFA